MCTRDLVPGARARLPDGDGAKDREEDHKDDHRRDVREGDLDQQHHEVTEADVDARSPWRATGAYEGARYRCGPRPRGVLCEGLPLRQERLR